MPEWGADTPLVRRVLLLRPRAPLLRFDTLPFFVAYAVCFLGFSLMPERSFSFLVAVPVLVLLQCLAFLGNFWHVGFRAAVSCSREESPEKASLVCVLPAPNMGKGAIVLLEAGTDDDGEKVFEFSFQKIRFSYRPRDGSAVFRRRTYPDDLQFAAYKRTCGIKSDKACEQLEAKYGKNLFEIPPIDQKVLLFEQLTSPFFVFQVFCVLLWMLDEYWYYSLFTLGMLVMFEMTVVKSRARNMEVMRSMVNPAVPMQVFRSGAWKSVSSEELLPGDVVSLTAPRSGAGPPCPADVLLLSGSVLANEALLTGESVPQLKEPAVDREDSDALSPRADKVHIVFGGTMLLQHTAAGPLPSVPRPPNGGATGVVLRTGLATEQGELVRTILFSSERITANTRESFAFIAILLVFAVVAAYQVLEEGLRDAARSRYKLALHCIMIVTSVVPPELPMELTLAVNNSMLELMRMGIFCTEPFRIPFAGRLTVCCFDKTGTLTHDELRIKGFAGISASEPARVVNADELSAEAELVLATCHALALVDGKASGDPVDVANLESIGWKLAADGSLAAQRGKRRGARVLRRFPFSSSLKRMSCVIAAEEDRRTRRIVVAKGAAEAIRPLLSEIPPGYADLEALCAKRGARVLALAWRPFEGSDSAARVVSRGETEQSLRFCGFALYEAEIKPGTQDALAALTTARHRCVVITGDHLLTAVHLANEVNIATQEPLLLDGTDHLKWRSWGTSSASNADGSVESFDAARIPALAASHALCVSGAALAALPSRERALLASAGTVFARVTPEQKESIVRDLVAAGETVLMCGDGTNDVGALKQAHVGVALMESGKGKPPGAGKSSEAPAGRAAAAGTARRNVTQRARDVDVRSRQQRPPRSMEEFLREAAADEDTIVRPGDATIAAPFTSRAASIAGTVDLVRQGRCAQVTTLQMFKILALNSLMSAYALSALYLDGIKLGDTQATISGLLIAIVFLFVSRARPVERLAPQRPPRGVFNMHLCVSVLGQFAVHLAVLIASVSRAKELLSVPYRPDIEGEFEPNLVNSVVFLVSSATTISTFAVNYEGRPFMQSLKENRGLSKTLQMFAVIILAATLEILPGLSETLELVPFPTPTYRFELAGLMVGSFILAYTWDRATYWLFRDR